MSGIIEAVTAAAGNALNQAGGVRMTRLARAAAPGDTQLVVERSIGLPVPGLVQVGGVSYRYGALADGALMQLQVVTPQGTFDGVQVAHPRNTLVVDASRSYSALDAIRAGLFVDTAEGEDLSVLGRLLGVPRLADVSDDAVYRALIKAIAYGPRPTRLGLQGALDALVGAGNYLLAEDPTVPGVVQVVLRAGELLDNNPVGKSYLPDARPAEANGTNLTAQGPLLHLHAIYVAATDFALRATAQPFASRTVTDDEGRDYGPLVLAPDDALQPTTVFTDVPAFSSSRPGHLYAQGPVDGSVPATVAAQVAVMRPGDLSASDGRRFMLQLGDGAQAVALGLFASGENIAVALCDQSGAPASGLLGTFARQQVAQLRLHWDKAAATAQVWLNCKSIYIGPAVTQPSDLPQGARWGCFADTAGFVTLLQVAASLRSTQDLGVQGSPDLSQDVLTVTTQAALPADFGRFVLRGDTVLSGQLVDNLGAINHRLTDGQPPTYLLWPAYLNEPTHLAQTYLQSMVALGVQVHVTQGLEGQS